MKWTTLIPIRRNDGSRVPERELSRIASRIWRQFGGATVEGPVKGHWVDPNDGRHYADECLRITVVCDSERLAEAERLVREIGNQLDQKAMYFEVQYFDGVRFLSSDE
jgi:hypothetical protein